MTTCHTPATAAIAGAQRTQGARYSQMRVSRARVRSRYRLVIAVSIDVTSQKYVCLWANFVCFLYKRRSVK